jgi:hypothetical protein
MFVIEERLFLWSQSNEVHVRYLLDVGMKAEARQPFRQ